MKVLDLFSGIGGFSLGLERAGMETVAFCEQDKHAQAVLKKHWPDVPIYDDVRTLNGEQFRGAVDVICGGFPCQDLSLSGDQAGISGERSGLYREVIRLIGECEPRFALLENVAGLLSGGGGRWFGKLLYDLAEVGLDAEWHSIPASYFGFPHRRDRVWIIAYSKSQRREGRGTLSDVLSQQVESMRSAEAFGNRCDLSAPRVCGKDDGIPRRLDRIRRLGNAVVPQIPEALGKAIIDYADQNLCN